jgi:hypothetical protein
MKRIKFHQIKTPRRGRLRNTRDYRLNILIEFTFCAMIGKYHKVCVLTEIDFLSGKKKGEVETC